ncbi:MAG TPA: hypothetical protein ENI23_10355 [bacterium]|nr:hypothetical protein [bacterium]
MPIIQQLPGGNFGQATGGGDALREAFQRRGIDASVLDQLTPGAPAGASPVPQNPSDLSAAQQALPTDTGAIPTTPTAPTAPPPTDPELTMVLEALTGFTKGKIGIQKDVVKGRLQGIL